MSKQHVLDHKYDWAAVPHRDLYRAVHDRNDPGEVGQISAEWSALSGELTEASRLIREAVTKAESGWEGKVAEVARLAMRELSDWTTELAETVATVSRQVDEQGRIMAGARAAMPEPVDFSYDAMTKPFSSGSIPELTESTEDLRVMRDQSLSGHERAVAVMREMEERSRAVDQVSPRFSLPYNPLTGMAQDPVPVTTNLVRPTSPVRDGMMYIASASPSGTKPQTQTPQIHREESPAVQAQQMPYVPMGGQPRSGAPNGQLQARRGDSHARPAYQLQNGHGQPEHHLQALSGQPREGGPGDQHHGRGELHGKHTEQLLNLTQPPTQQPPSQQPPAPEPPRGTGTGLGPGPSSLGYGGGSGVKAFSAMSGDLGFSSAAPVTPAIAPSGPVNTGDSTTAGSPFLSSTVVPQGAVPRGVPGGGPGGGPSFGPSLATDPGMGYMPPMTPGMGGQQQNDERQSRFLVHEDMFTMPGGDLPPAVIGESQPSTPRESS